MQRFFLVFLASCTISTATEVPVNREALKLHISAYEGGISPERLAALEGDVAGALIEMSRDAQEKAFFRARAMKALSHYPEERVFLHLKNSLSRPDTLGFIVLPEAIQAIATFGDRYPDEVTGALAPFTRHDSLVIKETTVRALAIVPSLRATDLLIKMSQTEREPVLQDALFDALK